MSTRRQSQNNGSAGLKLPPQNLDAERAVLGSIMLRPNAIFEIGDTLTKNSFYAQKHNIIYSAILDLSFKNEPIDILSVSNKLAEKGTLESIGGKSYVAELSGSVPASVNIAHYANIVAKNALVRRLISTADEITCKNAGKQRKRTYSANSYLL